MDLMYNEVYKEMVNAGVAVELDQPVWMDKDGNEVTESDAFGRKCTHKIIHPEMCLVVDEVGGNTNMVDDGHRGGEKFVVPKGTVPKLSAATKDSHFTVMGLTSLDGTPVMCVIVLSGKKKYNTCNGY